MIVILCADDHLGLRFNHRRQSRDRVLCERLLELTAGAELYMTGNSAKLFSADAQSQLHISDAPLDAAGAGDFCFLETGRLQPYRNRIEKLILFRWNRSYPSDEKLDLDLNTMRLAVSEDFAGYSHEKITREEYFPL